MIGNKNIQRGLMAVLMAVAMVFPLAGCENEADADDVEGGSDCIDVRGDFAVVLYVIEKTTAKSLEQTE